VLNIVIRGRSFNSVTPPRSTFLQRHAPTVASGHSGYLFPGKHVLDIRERTRNTEHGEHSNLIRAIKK
jgi:hypothetical protein